MYDETANRATAWGFGKRSSMFLMRARIDDFPQRHQADLPCPVLARKIFRFARRANHNYKLAPFYPA
jgi:hypothetical protein